MVGMRTVGGGGVLLLPPQLDQGLLQVAEVLLSDEALPDPINHFRVGHLRLKSYWFDIIFLLFHDVFVHVVSDQVILSLNVRKDKFADLATINKTGRIPWCSCSLAGTSCATQCSETPGKSPR